MDPAFSKAQSITFADIDNLNRGPGAETKVILAAPLTHLGFSYDEVG